MANRNSFYSNVGPRFLLDAANARWDDGHQINWAAISDDYQEDAFRVTLTAQANASATSLTVSALSKKIPIGTKLYFGQTAEFALVTAEAAAGATSITVEALGQQIESGDYAYYSPERIGKILPAGTIMVLEGGYMIPRAQAASLTVDAASNAAPIVLSLNASHGIKTGELLRVASVGGNTNANGIWRAVYSDADDVILAGSVGNANYTSGGTAVRAAYGILGSAARENDWSAARSGRGLIVSAHIYPELLPENAATAFNTYLEELAARGQFLFADYADSST